LKELSHLPIAVAIGTSCVLSLFLLNEVNQKATDPARPANAVGYEHTVTLWTWADLPDVYQPPAPLGANQPEGTATPSPAARDYSFDIGVTLRADPLTCIMLSMVTFVSTLVTIYGAGYMHGDRGYWRFFAYIGLFVFSMTMLVSVSNFVLLYVFWEAVGACSYLLVGFWYEKPSAAAAGKKAFLVNRVGDFGFALALFLIWSNYGTLNFHDTTITNTVTQVSETTMGVLGQMRLADPALFVGGGAAMAICLLLTLGACGKSAQFPLHVWLPDAMEGPTPVSALIHAATMVTAGVYMVTRCTPLFVASAGVPAFHLGDYPVDAGDVVAIIGGFTALFAGLIAMTQHDLKRVLAYSTISQLGYMFLGVGTGTMAAIVAGMFHLITHAFFKSLLFLGAGSVMHAMGGIIDMRKFSGLRHLMPVTCLTFLVGCLALSGAPPFSGFFSKDDILGAVHDKAHHAAELGHTMRGNLYSSLYWVGMIAAILTAFYTFRGFFLTFMGPEKIPAEAGHHAHESPRMMTVPLMILSVFAAFIGGVFFFWHGFADFLRRTPSLAFKPVADTFVAHAEPHWDVMLTSSFGALLGIGIAAYLYLGKNTEAKFLAERLGPLYRLSYNKFYIDEIYNALFVLPTWLLAKLSYVLDQNVIDGLVNLVGWIPRFGGRLLRSLQTGMVQFYALAMVLGLLVLIAALVIRPGG